MKATTYETGEKVVKTDHCDNYGTATIVTVLSIREDTPLMLITKRFEQCDNKYGSCSIRVGKPIHEVTTAL